MKNYVLPFLAVLLSFAAFAQNYAHYSAYMYNKLHFNPAYAGSNEQLDFNAFYRNQWSGIDGAPETISLNAHTNFDGNRAGIGLTLMNDKLGPINHNYGVVSYAYKIETSKRSTLGVGVSARVENYQVDFQNLERTHIDDPEAPTFNTNHTKANFGIGLMWYSDQEYIGFSVPRILNGHQNQIFALQNNNRNFFLNAGKIFRVSRNIKLHPAMMVGFVMAAPLKLDISNQVIFDDRIFLGVNYRLKESVAAVCKYQISNSIALGGSYELTTSRLNTFAGTTFEVFAEYSLAKRLGKKVNIRYF